MPDSILPQNTNHQCLGTTVLLTTFNSTPTARLHPPPQHQPSTFQHNCTLNNIPSYTVLPHYTNHPPLSATALSTSNPTPNGGPNAQLRYFSTPTLLSFHPQGFWGQYSDRTDYHTCEDALSCILKVGGINDLLALSGSVYSCLVAYVADISTCPQGGRYNNCSQIYMESTLRGPQSLCCYSLGMLIPHKTCKATLTLR